MRYRQREQLDLHAQDLRGLDRRDQLRPPPLTDLGRADGAGPYRGADLQATVEGPAVLGTTVNLEVLTGYPPAHALRRPGGRQKPVHDRLEGIPLSPCRPVVRGDPIKDFTRRRVDP